MAVDGRAADGAAAPLRLLQCRLCVPGTPAALPVPVSSCAKRRLPLLGKPGCLWCSVCCSSRTKLAPIRGMTDGCNQLSWPSLAQCGPLVPPNLHWPDFKTSGSSKSAKLGPGTDGVKFTVRVNATLLPFSLGLNGVLSRQRTSIASRTGMVPVGRTVRKLHSRMHVCKTCVEKRDLSRCGFSRSPFCIYRKARARVGKASRSWHDNVWPCDSANSQSSA